MSSFNVNTASGGAVKPWGGYFYLHFDERSPASRGADVCQWECALGLEARYAGFRVQVLCAAPPITAL